MGLVGKIAGPLFLRNLRALGDYAPEKCGRTLTIVSLLSALAGVLESVVVVAVGSVIETLGGDGSQFQLPLLGGIGWLALIGIIWACTLGALVIRALALDVSTQVSIIPMVRARERLVETYFTTSLDKQRSERAGELSELLVNQAPRVGLILAEVSRAISALTVLVVLAVAALLIDPLTFSVLVAAALLVVVFTVPMQRLMGRRGAQLSAAMLDYASVTTEAVGTAREVRLFSAQRVVVGQLHEASLTCARIIRRLYVWMGITPIIYRSVALALLLTGLAVSSRIGVSDIAQAGTVTLLMLRALLESQTVYRASIASRQHMPFLYEIRSRVERYEQQQVEQGTAELTAVTEVQLQDVHFSYPDASGADQPVLRGLDLTITAGQTVGVTGVSGTGKSTLASMLLGLAKPTQGRVLVNQQNPSDYESSSWTNQVSAVPQEPVLLRATVEENIRFFRDSITRADVERAARAAGIHDEVMTWPLAYDTVVGSQGSRALSGGQAQRVCIARALSGSPSLLVLDEPTSALDSAAEQVVADTISALGPGCIAIVISHRPVALRACNTVVTIDSGVVAASGHSDPPTDPKDH